MQELIEDYGRVSAACIEVFDLRAIHSWPPMLNIEPTWPDTYRQLAAELGFPTEDITGATARVQALIDAIHNAEPQSEAT